MTTAPIPNKTIIRTRKQHSPLWYRWMITVASSGSVGLVLIIALIK